MVPTKWDEVGHDAIEKAQTSNELITASPTNLAKWGAPAVAVVTALLAGILGDSWHGGLDPTKPGVVVAAAIIVAAVVLGVCFIFLTDIHTRGAVTIARFEAITALAENETRANAAEGAQKTAQAAQEAAEADLAAKKHEIEELRERVWQAILSVQNEKVQHTLEAILREGNGETAVKT